MRTVGQKIRLTANMFRLCRTRGETEHYVRRLKGQLRAIRDMPECLYECESMPRIPREAPINSAKMDDMGTFP